MENRIRVTTLEGMDDKMTSKRRDGNTTRLVDNAIQILFSGNICVVRDHHEWGNNRKANKYLFHRIMTRLDAEHGYVSTCGIVETDLNHLEIWLSAKGKKYYYREESGGKLKTRIDLSIPD